MIVYDLECRTGAHRFEGWFASSDAFADQRGRGLLACPHCGSSEVDKAVQAPRLARKGNQMPSAAPATAAPASAPPAAIPAGPASAAPAVPMAVGALPPQAVEALRQMAKIQAEALSQSRYVGDRFVEDARAMHYGERDAEPIHGRASLEEARDLLDEGIALIPLPFPVVPPEQSN